MDEKAMYQEAAHMLRYYLGWRHATVVGYVAMLFGTVTLALGDGSGFRHWIFIAAAPVGFILWLIDRRTRELYHTAILSAAQFEPAPPAPSIEGVFTRMQRTPKEFSHTTAIAILFLGYSAAMLAIGVASWRGWL